MSSHNRIPRASVFLNGIPCQHDAQGTPDSLDPILPSISLPSGRSQTISLISDPWLPSLKEPATTKDWVLLTQRDQLPDESSRTRSSDVRFHSCQLSSLSWQ